MVAAKGESETVRTSLTTGGGPGGAAGVVVVKVVSVGAVVGVVVVDAAGPGPKVRKLRSAAYGVSKAMALESPLELGELLLRPAGLEEALVSACRPGLAVGPPVSSSCGVTGRPVGGANSSPEESSPTAPADAAARFGSVPGSPTRKPIVEPATTASRSQRTVRRGTQ
jgi:hypothetical protein